MARTPKIKSTPYEVTELGNNFFLFSAKAPEQLTYKSQRKLSTEKVISYGHKNDYPQDLIRAVQQSPIAMACTETHAKFLYGDGLIFDKDSDFAKKLKLILSEEFYQNICYDFAYMESIGLKLEFNLNGKITNIDHQDVSTIRLGVLDDLGNINYVKLSSNWEDINKPENKPIAVDLHDPVRIQEKIKTFNNPDKLELFPSWAGAIEYIRRYKPGQTFYTKPKYSAAINWIYVDGQIQVFHSNNVDNAFAPSVIIYVPYELKGKTQDGREKKDVFKEETKERLQGAKNGGEAAVLFGPNKDAAPQIIPFSANNNHELYIALSNLIRDHIATSYQIPPVIAGIQVAGKLGTTKEIIDATELYQNTVIKHDQNLITSRLNKLIMQMEGFDGTKVSVSNNLPIRYIPEEALKHLNPSVILKYYGFDPVKDLVGATSEEAPINV